MKLTKEQKNEVYRVAIGLKRMHPDWSNHSCIEDAFLRCAGFEQYNAPLETMFPEYAANPKSDIVSYIK